MVGNHDSGYENACKIFGSTNNHASEPKDIKTFRMGRFGTEPQTGLTYPEIEVFQMLADGYSRKEMADKLDISPRTVEFRLQQAYRLLGVKSVNHGLAELFRKGLIK